MITVLILGLCHTTLFFDLLGGQEMIAPAYVLAFILAAAYIFDFIPPVPLVKRDIQVGTQLTKVIGKHGVEYTLQQDKTPVWFIWRRVMTKVIHINPGEGVYCISAIFAPAGIKTKLYHNWQLYDEKRGWVSKSRVGFDVAGGRNNGFRGYTIKTNLQYGEWRVSVETENARTIAIYEFDVKKSDGDQERIAVTL